MSPKIQPEAELNSRRIDSLGHQSAGSHSLGRQEGRRLGRPGCVWVPAFAGSFTFQGLRVGLNHHSLSRNVQGEQGLAPFRSQAPGLAVHYLGGLGGKAQTQTAHLDPQALPLPSIAKLVSPTSCSSCPGLHPLPRATLLPTSGLCPCSSLSPECSLPAVSPLRSCLLLRPGSNTTFSGSSSPHTAGFLLWMVSEHL